ncbi:hypothetical protein Plano_1187 [Planococcus sp. PAMC 21323]|uniref:hypothetical protein n=1 Tax=Planococcus sp. PAMC 21323 TaxID=1526927 RepID=UPI000570C149|nr:hypothetical protein [Planococcus sp. PAMC 21323]AIY05152.1 hypothetical protein Plano_1187 [Planococcus sp. PAMC 21323]
MKHLKNQHGYALVVVLLVVVLFMSLSATFIAGSLNHSKQEQAIDVNNHAVAAAEMGTLYFTSDFERELQILKQDMNQQTQVKLNSLIACIKTPLGSACDTEAKRLQWEKTIDQEMKTVLIGRIMTKVQELNTLVGTKTVPFSAENINYSILNVTALKFNAEQKNVALSSTTNKEVAFVEVKMEVQGASEGSMKKLVATFLIKIPKTFLNPDEPIKVDTIVVTKDQDLTYENIYTLVPPTQSCSALLVKAINKTATAPYECAAATGEKLSNFIAQIKNAKLNLTDFRVYTSNFKDYVCGTNCNNITSEGVSVVVRENDADASNNINNLVSTNIIINGKIEVGNNMNNLGKDGNKQTIIAKELIGNGNIKNMKNTNLLVLGYNTPVGNPKIARITWGNHFEVLENAKLCINIDRINTTDLRRLSQEINFSGTGKLVYYSTDRNKVFELKDSSNADRTVKNGKNVFKMTDLYVQRASSYSSFLSSCGVSLKSTNTFPLDVSVPSPIDTEIDLEIEY